MTRSLASWLLAAIAVASLVVFSAPIASADLIGSTPSPGPAQTFAHAPATAVAATLRAQGLNETEISNRLAEMHTSDLAHLAASPQQVQMAGVEGTVIAAIVIAAIVIVVLLIIFFDKAPTEE